MTIQDSISSLSENQEVKVCSKSNQKKYNRVVPDKPGMLQCTKCKEYLPATTKYFTRSKTGLLGFRSHCQSCINESRVKRYKKNAANREYKNERKGLTHSDSIRCRTCNEYFPATTEFFPKQKKRLLGLGSSCKKCTNEIVKKAQSKMTGVCARCGKPTVRRKKYCSDECKKPMVVALNKDGKTCLKCGVPLLKNQKTFCSRKCFHNSIRRSNETCKFCGKEYFPKATDRTTYCSRDCYYAHKTEISIKREFYKAVTATDDHDYNVFKNHVHGVCEICGQDFTGKACVKFCSDDCRREKARRSAFITNSLGKSIIPIKCRECGSEFTPEYGDKRKVFCSTKCRMKYSRRGKNKNRNKARKYGVAYEPVDPMKVFRRDGWRCQICGKPTPKRNRGTLYSNAPELDHRIPISKGGDHLYSNVQCTCRRCNGKKSNNSNAGYIPMFGVGSIERLNEATA